MKDYFRHSKRVTRGRRWYTLRMAVLERDGWACVKCGEPRWLEVDHIQPVRTHPHLSYAPGNCQVLCRVCHTKKTRIEIGASRPDTARDAWKKAVQELHHNPHQQNRG